MIVGHGIDLVEVARIKGMLEKHGEHFLARCFTPAERAYCRTGKREHEHLAGRFAAKEAVLKVLGTGWRQGIAWTDIEVLPDLLGRPRVRLEGQCAVIAEELGISAWHISISHTESHAMASAVGEKI